jgi:3-oxoacyl-[acyl-carrier protein] reductase
VTIDGSAIVVTGGASGIGLQFVRHMSARGARVWVLDRDPDALAAATRELAAFGNVTILQCDVGDEARVAEAVSGIWAASGGVDVLVNNAAILRDQSLAARLGKTVTTHSLDDWNETLRCNLTGTFLMARALAEQWIRAKRRGLIVNVSSISRHGNPGQTAYSATKAAVDALTVTWSRELAAYGIRVVAIAPGFVETPMTRRIPPLFLESLRFGTLEEFGHALQFVVENDYLNGKVLELDGGLRF